MAKSVICLWYNGAAEEAARFYARTFPDSAVTAVHHAPGDYPDGKQGQVMMVEFTVLGIPCLGLNGGPAFKHSEAFSFQITAAPGTLTRTGYSFRLWKPKRVFFRLPRN
jgi:predicted 3-demethylubiquinone-9 3-methyltransferase (glyoxalase superfamily)